jgi:hypothetical protein
MTGPAIQDDLSIRSLRVLTERDLVVGATMLEDAWGILTSRISGLQSRVDAYPRDEALRALVVQVQCAMVLRVLYNPTGMLSETQDDYSYRLDSAVSTGALYVSDAEIDLLSAGDAVSQGAFTIKPAGWRR